MGQYWNHPKQRGQYESPQKGSYIFFFAGGGVGVDFIDSLGEAYGLFSECF